MLRFVQNLLCIGICLTIAVAMIEARPPSALGDNNQDLDTLEPQMDEVHNPYYDLTAQALYQNIPMEKLQFLIRPPAYLRAPAMNSFDELYRMPESKRQVRYRQCYFNPISCFRK